MNIQDFSKTSTCIIFLRVRDGESTKESEKKEKQIKDIETGNRQESDPHA